MRLPVSACIIVRDNPQIGILLRLLRDFVEEIVVVDTGSTDATVAICIALADRVEVFTDCNGPDGKINNFGAARRHSFCLATQEAIVWYDSDDEPRGIENLGNELAALRALRQQFGKPVLLQYDYDYAQNAGGIAVRHNRERLLLREDWHARAFTWKDRVHELIVPTGADDSIARIRRPRESMVWVHRQSSSQGREPGRDLRILRIAMEEEGGLANASLRTLYCFVGECVASKLFDEAQAACHAYLVRPGATAERSLLLGYLAKIAQLEKRPEDALRHAMLAFANAQGDTPGGVESRGIVADASKDACFTIGDIYRTLAADTDVDRARHANLCAVRFFRMGLTMADSVATSSFPQTAFAARLGLIDALRALDRSDEALLVVEESLQLAPGAPQFLKHRGELNFTTTKNVIVQGIARLHEWGGVSDDDVAGLAGILNTAPNVAHAITDPAPPVFIPPTKGKLDIILACGDTREVWNPDLVEKVGIGGSETAACDWARGMVARGHRVRVYTRCGEPKVYDGVEYLPTAALDGSSADAVVAWRFPRLLQKVTAPVKLAWAHDTTLLGDVTAGMNVVALSQWHKASLYEAHLGVEVFVIPSAIRVEDFADGGTTKRRPHAAVCMSAHERHLVAFIDIWPRIRAQVPDATLDLFYGYDDWKRIPSNAVFAEQIRYFDRKRPMLEAAGVTFHPRMPPKEIARRMLSASVWLYPTAWPETWCAAAAQAQVAGLHSVTTRVAAMPEIFEDPLADHVYLLKGEGHPRGWNLEPNYQDRFVKRAVAALSLSLPSETRMALRHRATARFGWSRCLDDWEVLLTEQAKTVCPVFAFPETQRILDSLEDDSEDQNSIADQNSLESSPF